MQDNLRELIEDAYVKTGIHAGLIEKDYYVTRLVKLISPINNEYFKLIFGGGTCLAKAHGITKRMSEDIDFKVIKKDIDIIGKKTQRKEFRKLKESIVEVLKNTEFKCSPRPTEGRNNHLKIDISYPAIFPRAHNAREDVLLELTISEAKMPVCHLSVNTLIQDCLGNDSKLDTCELECVSVEETAAEKWVALTRRVAEAVRYSKAEDDRRALIRHIYDLFMIENQSQLSEVFFSLAKKIVHIDKEQYKKHKEYYNDPINEIYYSLELLKGVEFKNYYNEFLEVYLYEKKQPPFYSEALKIVEKISVPIIASL